MQAHIVVLALDEEASVAASAPGKTEVEDDGSDVDAEGVVSKGGERPSSSDDDRAAANSSQTGKATSSQAAAVSEGTLVAVTRRGPLQ